MNVIITGVGKGVGLALAKKFLAEGFLVCGSFYENKPDFSDDNFFGFPLDLGSEKSRDEAVAELKKRSIKFDILINNAGVLLDDEETSVVLDKLRKTLGVNLIGAIDFTEKVLPLLSDTAHIVNVSSTAGSLGEMKNFIHSHAPFRYPAYKISKTALNMYTCTLALRMSREKPGVVVSSVHPGWVKTDMGGEDADMSPSQAADGIYNTAISRPESGGFWFSGERVPW